ncbi:flavodoxin domain-containing protein [Hoeflea sp.]|uniref:flavodoxin domain-containing protein n=1 Tax=Hoeflea sp. TaxID=1940281 RepID=UPI003B521982
MAILILYATVEGHSRTIAEHAAGLLESRGHSVVIGDMREPGFAVPGRFDGILLCAPIHIGRYPDPLFRFVADWKDALDDVPNAFVSVSLAIASDSEEERAEARTYPALLEKAGYRPKLVHHAAGALKYIEYDFFKRMMMRRIAAKEGGPVDTGRDHILTDWDALDAFVSEFSDLVASGQGGKHLAM